jgi:hypothetical protein
MPELGDRAFEVEWCFHLPRFEDGTCDIDGAKHKRRFARTIEDAFAIAREVYPQDKFGSVTITPVEWIDPYKEGIRQLYRWEYVGDSKHFDDATMTLEELVKY